jgi:hypothetical protein
VVVGEAVGVAADLLGEHVDVLDASVRRSLGVVIGEDFGVPAVDRAGEPLTGHEGVLKASLERGLNVELSDHVGSATTCSTSSRHGRSDPWRSTSPSVTVDATRPHRCASR